MEGQIEKGEEIIYAPSALLHLFNNALTVNQTRRMVRIKGVYLSGKGNNYNGYYYDSLRDESSDALLTLIVPALLRTQLTANKTILFYGYITRRVVTNGGRIELQINLSDLIEQTQNRFSEEDVRKLELQQQKSEAGYRDVQTFLKSRIINGEPVHIDILIGRTAIIDQDILHQLEETVAVYDIRYHRVSFTSETEIIYAISQLDDAGADLIVIARGSGDNIQLFDKPAIAAACLGIKAMLVTAIGHKDDNPLLQKIADKSFITPTAFGQFLNDLYNSTIEELQNSRAKLVADITQTLQANYGQQIKQLNEQIQAVELQKQIQVRDINQLNQQEKMQLEEISKQKLELLNTSLVALKEQKQQKEQQAKQTLKRSRKKGWRKTFQGFQ
ncbi:MAG: hypothetical protein EOO04_02250 [Chitinophagaceae bacterium]|nr:MAG: hypothetical protein EOO04_02250 [Chitinophagaceae bacterium]